MPLLWLNFAPHRNTATTAKQQQTPAFERCRALFGACGESISITTASAPPRCGVNWFYRVRGRTRSSDIVRN